MKRLFDIILAWIILLTLSIPMLIIALAVKLSSKGPALHWSSRVGVDNKIFKMPKFRTMIQETPALATHLLQDPKLYITKVGLFLRKYSLDELPQLLCVIRGNMSFVGPRPALFNQDDLISLRTSKGVQKLVPGITGWAQINGRDELTIPIKVAYDEYYMLHRSLLFDIEILMRTLLRVIKCDGISH